MARIVSDFKKKQKRHSFSSWALQAGLILIILLSLLLIIANIRMYQRKRELRVQLESLKNKVAEMKEKNNNLQEGISNTNNPGYIEKIAREELDLQKPGESVVSFVEAEVTTSTSTQDSQNALVRWLGWLGGLFKK